MNLSRNSIYEIGSLVKNIWLRHFKKNVACSIIGDFLEKKATWKMSMWASQSFLDKFIFNYYKRQAYQNIMYEI